MSPELTARVRTVERVSTRVALIRIEPGRPFPFVAGQAIRIGLATQAARLHYSIASAPAQVRACGALDVLVVLDGLGAFPPHLSGLARGSIVGVQGPLGSFGLPPRVSGRNLLFVAGGTGIAPLRSLLRAAIDRPRPPRVDVVYSARSPRDLAFDAEFRRMQGDGSLGYWPTVTRYAGAAWRGRRGRVDREWLGSALRPSPVCLLCGPASFVDDMTAALRTLGVRESSIRRERS